jgi:hypothetical protein
MRGKKRERKRKRKGLTEDLAPTYVSGVTPAESQLILSLYSWTGNV